MVNNLRKRKRGKTTDVEQSFKRVNFAGTFESLPNEVQSKIAENLRDGTLRETVESLVKYRRLSRRYDGIAKATPQLEPLVRPANMERFDQLGKLAQNLATRIVDSLEEFYDNHGDWARPQQYVSAFGPLAKYVPRPLRDRLVNVVLDNDIGLDETLSIDEALKFGEHLGAANVTKLLSRPISELESNIGDETTPSQVIHNHENFLDVGQQKRVETLKKQGIFRLENDEEEDEPESYKLDERRTLDEHIEALKANVKDVRLDPYPALFDRYEFQNREDHIAADREGNQFDLDRREELTKILEISHKIDLAFQDALALAKDKDPKILNKNPRDMHRSDRDISR